MRITVRVFHPGVMLVTEYSFSVLGMLMPEDSFPVAFQDPDGFRTTNRTIIS